MRYESAFERYDVPILVAPLAVVFVVLCALTFRDAQASAIHGVGIAGLAGVLVRAARGRPASRRRGARRTWRQTPGRTKLTGMLKHGAELAGWMLLATGMVAAASPPTRTGSLSVTLATPRHDPPPQARSAALGRSSVAARPERSCCRS